MKYIAGIIAAVLLVVGVLFLVFRFVVKPHAATVKTGGAELGATARPAAPPPTDRDAQRINAIGSLIGELGGAAKGLGFSF